MQASLPPAAPVGSVGCSWTTIELAAPAGIANGTSEAAWAVPAAVLRRAGVYLRRQWTPGMDHPPLWMGKTLYAPLHIIDSVILCALFAWETAAAEMRHAA